ncbi:MAG: substrate-binding domain-containing protein [Verrucomicrobiae bacterium]|nr:substrate-binding domain-containing protein [Verrucomicrobiae bacterium]
MKTVIRPLSLLPLAALVLTACGPQKQPPLHKAEGTKPSPTREIKIAVIPKGTTHEFWKSIHAGAVKAQREYAAKGTKIDLIWKGPLKEDDREQQIQVVENFIGRQVSGMVLAPLDSKALVSPVESSVSAGIPVVIIDSGLESDRPASTVSTDNFRGGVTAAREMGRLLSGRGNLIVLRYAVGSASTEAREKGFMDTLTSEFPGIKVLSSDQYAGPTRETSYQASQNLLNKFGKNIQGVYTPNESSTSGMTLALKDAGLAGGKVKHVGFDASTILVESLRKGDIQALVIQDPFRMGYQGVITLMHVLEGKPVEKSVDTGVGLVTRENIDKPEVQAQINPPLREYLGE